MATDGRRLVVTELDQADATDGPFEVILPPKLCRLAGKLIEKGEEGHLQIYVRQHKKKDETPPADVYVVGPGWVLHAPEVKGLFPRWRDVVPQGGSRFMLDRDDLLRTVQEVSLACPPDNQGVRLHLGSESIRVSARSGDGSESSGQCECRYLGGGDKLIITGFNPSFLIDCFESLSAGRIMIELDQDTRSAGCCQPR